MVFDKPITLQTQDPNTEQWTDSLQLHAHVNKAGGSTAFNAGADQYRVGLTFTVRYCRELEALHYSPQPFRIVYRGRKFKLTDYDDYMEQHKTVRLAGEFYE
ncbi:MAG: phage head closure protein [Bacteroidales bacterium]|nr:phage head closure protein [Bacteroidales bacterium]